MVDFFRKINDKNLYYIGGVVRDELLGTKSLDIDLCYEGDAIEFAHNNIPETNILKVNPNFGTVRVKLDNKEFDIASTRAECYPRKGHLPQITKIGCSLEEDLKRRDFTINAIAKRVTDGKIIDCFSGLDDINKRKLKILHENSFIDDPTRIIRGLKFSVRLGFELNNKTEALQKEYLNNINYDMSYHRLKKELVETFNLNKSEALDKFINTKMYNLLGENQKSPCINTKNIESILNNYKTKHCWLIYLSMFNLDNLPLTRAEKKILEWKERLEYEQPTNNTPKESIIISKII